MEDAPPGSLVAVLPCRIPLSTRSLNDLADLIRTHRHQRRSHWRRPRTRPPSPAGPLRNGDTFARLAPSFQIGVATAWRYIREATTLLATTADDLHTAMARIRLLAYAILDGTLIPIDCVHHQKPHFSASIVVTV